MKVLRLIRQFSLLEFHRDVDNIWEPPPGWVHAIEQYNEFFLQRDAGVVQSASLVLVALETQRNTFRLNTDNTSSLKYHGHNFALTMHHVRQRGILMSARCEF